MLSVSNEWAKCEDISTFVDNILDQIKRKISTNEELASVISDAVFSYVKTDFEWENMGITLTRWEMSFEIVDALMQSVTEILSAEQLNSLYSSINWVDPKL